MIAAGRRLRFLTPGLAIALLIPHSRALAEVAAIPNGASGTTATVEIFDREPAPWRIWSPMRTGVDPALLLNPGGDLLLDGPPSVLIDPATSLPVAAWASRRGNHFQILISRFDGSAWTMVPTPEGDDYLALTADPWDNLDPRLSLDRDGNLALVWWRQAGPSGCDEVVLSVKAPGRAWTVPETVSYPGVQARRPSAVFVPGVGAFVAMEQEDAAGISLIVAQVAQGGWPWVQRESDPWGRTIVREAGTAAPRSAELGISLTAAGAVPSLTWQEGEDLAVSVFDPESAQWAAPVYTVYPIW